MIKKKDIEVTVENRFKEDEIVVRSILNLAHIRVLTDDSLRSPFESKRLVYSAQVECRDEIFDRLYGEFCDPILKLKRNIDLLKRYLIDNCHPAEKATIEEIEEAADELCDLIK